MGDPVRAADWPGRAAAIDAMRGQLGRADEHDEAALDALRAAGYAVVRRPEYDTPVAHVFVVDVADEARRMFGAEAAAHIRGGPMPEHDYRLHMATPTGGRVTFSAGGTADEVMAWLARWKAERATSPAEP